MRCEDQSVAGAKKAEPIVALPLWVSVSGAFLLLMHRLEVNNVSRLLSDRCSQPLQFGIRNSIVINIHHD